VSGFWHSLRADKDRWSTTNQGTGVYVFDTFVRHLKAQGVNVVGQFHDEVILDVWDTHAAFEALQTAIDLTNKQLNMNVPFLIDYEIGDNYSSIH
jgi:DNA polymerase I-like protein with 3'-5' exonuclease and polymerase domains